MLVSTIISFLNIHIARGNISKYNVNFIGDTPTVLLSFVYIHLNIHAKRFTVEVANNYTCNQLNILGSRNKDIFFRKYVT